MGGINVKNTIVERMLTYLAPHPCSGCGKMGSLLCDYCKYDIIGEPFVGCVLCGVPHLMGICSTHTSAINRAFIVGRRADALKTLIDGLKFHHIKAAATEAARLLHESLPFFPAGTVIVPIPTVAAHIRERGYDQVALIAAHLGSLRGMPVAPLLRRANKATQHHLSRSERQESAQTAFVVNNTLIGKYSAAPKLILDDIITTGATVDEAARLLVADGALIFVAALAYQLNEVQAQV